MAITFVIEDGTGLADATSYVSVVEMEQYWENNAYDYSLLTEGAKQILLNRSTLYIDNNYRNSFPGYREAEVQRLEWPRFSAYYVPSYYEIDEGTVPREIKDAVSEMAYLMHIGNTPSAIISKAGKVIAESSQVDVIKESLKYEEGSTLYQDVYTSVDEILSRITGGVSDRFTLTILRAGGDSS